jgi:hypothetical protein
MCRDQHRNDEVLEQAGGVAARMWMEQRRRP